MACTIYHVESTHFFYSSRSPSRSSFYSRGRTPFVLGLMTTPSSFPPRFAFSLQKRNIPSIHHLQHCYCSSSLCALLAWADWTAVVFISLPLIPSSHPGQCARSFYSFTFCHFPKQIHNPYLKAKQTKILTHFPPFISSHPSATPKNNLPFLHPFPFVTPTCLTNTASPFSPNPSDPLPPTFPSSTPLAVPTTTGYTFFSLSRRTGYWKVWNSEWSSSREVTFKSTRKWQGCMKRRSGGRTTTRCCRLDGFTKKEFYSGNAKDRLISVLLGVVCCTYTIYFPLCSDPCS